jgi:catechol 2,3-dioxygenase-like lactoylglutathione lyase family enzyme
MNVVGPSLDIGLLVRDVDACLRFYCDVLGFPKVEERVIGDRHQHRIQIGATLLKLYELRGRVPPPPSPGRDSQAGYRYLTITVDDAYSAAAELEARGISFIAPPHANSAGDTVASFEDPEGNTIEIFSAKRT